MLNIICFENILYLLLELELWFLKKFIRQYEGLLSAGSLPTCCHAGVGLKLQPGTRNAVQVFHVGIRNSVTWALSATSQDLHY